MIRRFTKILTLVVLVLIAGIGSAQDFSNSQFMANPLFLNPALAGSNLGPRAALMYRNQWPNYSCNFESYTASYDQNLEFLHSGFGASFASNKIGGNALVTATMSAYYAYQMEVSDDFHLSLGLRGTYFQKRLNWTLVNSSPLYDTIKTMVGVGSGTPSTTVKNYDISFGLAFTYKENAFGGFSVEHLNSPNISFFEADTLSNLGIKTSLFAGINIDVRKKAVRGTYYVPLIVTPTIYYQGRTGFQQVSIGSYVTRGPIFVAGFYRMDFNNDAALVALIGGQYKQLIIGYSFDYSLSSNTNFDGGAHEITLTFQINNGLHRKPQSTKLGPLPSPGF